MGSVVASRRAARANARVLGAGVLALLALGSPGGERAAAGQATEDVRSFLRALGTRQQAIRTLRAHFEQEKHLTIVRGVLRSSGILLLDKSGRVAWDVEDPERMRIVFSADGVFAGGKPVADAAGAGSLSPLPMVKGLTDLFAGLSEATLDRFDVTLPTPESVRLVPRGPELARWVEALEITLDPARGVPRSIRLEEPGGDVSEIRLTHLETNPALTDRDFAP